MDKTGTLTDGKFIVRNVIDFTDETDILQIMAALEGSSTHPIAQSIVSAAKPLKNLKVEAVENIPGVGIKGQVNQNFYQIVNYKYLRENQLSYDEQKIAQYLDLGLTVSFLINEQQDVLGFIALGDSPKADAKAFINGLLAQGITPVMLTGDNKETAQKIASALNIPEFRAELKPEDKAEIVKEYQKKAGVLFIGDGVNDSPALATATIGVAIGAGTSVAISTADVVLVNSNPSDVLDMINISKRMLRKMKQNLWFGAGYNIIAIPLAMGALYIPFGIKLNPMIASFAMCLSSISVVLTAMTLFNFKNVEVKTMEKEIFVEGMMCTHCEHHVKEALEKIKGVKEATPDFKTGKVILKCSKEIKNEDIANAVSKAGYKVK